MYVGMYDVRTHVRGYVRIYVCIYVYVYTMIPRDSAHHVYVYVIYNLSANSCHRYDIHTHTHITHLLNLNVFIALCIRIERLQRAQHKIIAIRGSRTIPVEMPQNPCIYAHKTYTHIKAQIQSTSTDSYFMYYMHAYIHVRTFFISTISQPFACE